MSYNGSGVFNINTAGQPVVTGTTISSTTFNNLTADLATGLTTALTKDGQSTPTANIGLGTYKIVNLGAGTVASDAARLDQVQGGAATFITVTGTDTLTGTVSPALSAYATGNQFSFLVANTNTGAVTLNVDGIGSKAITRTGTTALVAGDMVAGQAVEIIYDGTRFQLVNGNSFTNLKVSGTLGVTGVATFTAQPIASSLTASLPVFTDASKGLVSNTMTGTGSVAMSASPTFTGTVGAVDITTTGNTILGNASTDTLNVGNGGLVKDASGNVGIGTASMTGTGALRGSYGTGGITSNFAAGDGALNANTTGIQNTAVGYTSLNTNTTGNNNQAFGYQTLFSNLSGSSNTAMGLAALRWNTASNNTAVGFQAMIGASGTSTGANNSALGYQALYSNTTGTYNSAFGYQSLNNVTTGSYNTAYGSSSLAFIVSNSNNSALGYQALYYNTASNNTAVGYQAMQGASGTSTGTGNAALGYQALYSNTSGNYNSAFGTNAQKLNTTGVNNVALGVSALQNNLTGNHNSAMGLESLFYNTASNNTAVGYQAMYGASGTSTGANNAALGYQALYSNTTGASNSAMGQYTLYSNTTGSNNSAMGYQSLYYNLTGQFNSAFGQSALLYNTASNNTAVGYQAMQGASGTSTGASNAALGYQALYANTSGQANAAVGVSALYSNTSGASNTAIGRDALYFNITGSNNSTLGWNSLSANTTGNNNTVVGYSTALLLTTGDFNQVFGDNITLAAAATGRIAIGRNFTQGVNTSVIIGNGTNRISNSYTVNATWAFSSDERIKNVIGKDTLGLDFINDLEPVTFRWKPSNEVPKELTSRYAEENVQDTDLVMHGLIAQNVKAALDKAGVDTFTGWSEDEDGTQKLGITDLITPMINAIKELTARVKQLEGK